MWVLKEPFFCLQCVLFLLSEWYLQSSKETFCLACFYFYLQFEHFSTAAFFSLRKMTTVIFSPLLWYHSPQTEQNAMKFPLPSFGSSLKNGSRHLQYNGKRCVTSFPRLTRFACCGNGAIVSFSNCANRYCKFFAQAYGCTRYQVQKVLQKFCNHTHFLAAAPILKLCDALLVHFFLNALFFLNTLFA